MSLPMASLSISGKAVHGRPPGRTAGGLGKPLPSTKGRALASTSKQPSSGVSTSVGTPSCSSDASSSSAQSTSAGVGRAPQAGEPQASCSASATASTSSATARSSSHDIGIVRRPGMAPAAATAPKRRAATVTAPQPKSMKRGKVWNEEVEDAFRFQLAGFRDATEYEHFHGGDLPDRWPNGLVKVLKLKSGYFYCYNRNRECAHKDIHCTKIYSY
ncbi:uncharacterized protein LOC135819672 isoform X3 [Sycon ciliatum]|uniref:uncharacterized protein LOC135819672 isoform X2 n=1 Tax=Sycon ciliatum TaxID=27933 RepID=UPI0031F6174A